MVTHFAEETSEFIFRIKVKPKSSSLLTQPFFDNHGPEDVHSKVVRTLRLYLLIDLGIYQHGYENPKLHIADKSYKNFQLYAFQDSVNLYCRLCAFDTVQTGRKIQVFRRNLLHVAARSSKHAGTHLPDYTVTRSILSHHQTTMCHMYL
jgi:hypothetical protein